MIKKYIFFPFVLCIVGLFIVSSTNGPGDDYTGAPMSNGNCKNCHTGSADLDAGLNIIATLKGSLTPTTTFESGKTYQIAVAVTGGLSIKRGFQATVLNPENNLVGTYANPSTGARIGNYNNRKILEHTSTNLLGAGTMEWTAPATLAPDSVIIYAAGNATNSASGSDGDQGMVKSMTLYLDKTAGTITQNKIVPTVYPNPFSNYITLPENCSEIAIYNLVGELQFYASTQSNQINLGSLKNGIYFIGMIINGKEFTQKIVKS